MHKNPYLGKFIVFEGLDGSGETTQVSLFGAYVENLGSKVFITKEPTKNSEYGKEIEDILKHRKTAEGVELQKLFAKDRNEHLEKEIIPALKEGTNVISDRYFFSSFAFGSIDCDLEWLIELNDDFILPDATFVLMVKPETAVERIKKRGLETTFFEELEKLKKVIKNYESLRGRFENLFFIDGERSIEEVHKEIVEKARNFLK
ncbi:MAG: dTMP kinase [Candidatus Liptonbacteria bacterium]|nr:dTMP kinase [Candidatus Liptonbacteria bacterium]